MKKILILLALLTVNLTAQDDVQRVLDAVSKAKPTPHETSISRVEYDKKIHEIGKSLVNSIHHYPSVRDFVLEATGSLYSQFTLSPIDDDLFHGLMGADVYVVRSPRGAPIGILKIYSHDFRQFAEEVWAFSHINKLRCVTLRPPELYGAGATTIDGHKVLMTFQEYAPGESLDTMIRTYLDTHKGFRKLCQAYFLMGKALAELHQSKVGVNAPVHPIIEDTAQHYFTSGINHLKNNPTYNVETKKLSEKFQGLWSKIQKTPQKHRYTHFDVHGGNYKVNLVDLQVWILDLEPAGYSIASNGEPIGVSALDYVQTIEYLKSYKIQGLEKKDYKSIRNAFKRGYQTKMEKPSRHERDFYELVDALIYLDFYHSRVDSFSEKNRKLLKAIVDDRVNRIMK